jgi:hypothetical protein
MLLRILDFKGFRKAPMWFLVLTFPGWVIWGVFAALIYTLGEMSHDR